MATFYKDLIGRIDMVGHALGNTYNLVLPTVTGTALPNSLANQVIEEVYIICDSTAGNITINLPAISLLNNVWNPKIYISYMAGAGTVTITPYTDEVAIDSLNGLFGAYTMGNVYEAVYLHAIDDHTWIKLVCAGPTPPPPIG